jgi:antitoxin ChpS
MLAIPPVLLDVLHLNPGAQVGMTVEGGRLVIEPAPRPRYSLDELLAQCNPDAALSPQEKEWLAAPAVGREVI